MMIEKGRFKDAFGSYPSSSIYIPLLFNQSKNSKKLIQSLESQDISLVHHFRSNRHLIYQAINSGATTKRKLWFKIYPLCYLLRDRADRMHINHPQKSVIIKAMQSAQLQVRPNDETEDYMKSVHASFDEIIHAVYAHYSKDEHFLTDKKYKTLRTIKLLLEQQKIYFNDYRHTRYELELTDTTFIFEKNL